ncbi:MAG: WD40 repeat domain-containing protein, partial [Pseudomonadota bacterium]
IAASRDGIVRCWPMDGDASPRVFAGRVFQLPPVPLLSHGPVAAVLSTDCVILVDIKTGETMKRFDHGDGASVRSAAVSADGRTLVTGSGDGLARLWSLADETPPQTLKGHGGAVLDACFSPDGTMVATAGGADGTARLWRTGDRTLLGTLPGKARDVQSVAFSPDGRHLAVASWDGIARLFDTATQAPLAVLEECWLDAIHPSFSPDGRQIVTAGFGAPVRIWDVLSGHAVMTLPVEDGQRALYSPSGDTILVVHQHGRLQLFDGRTAEPCGTIEGAKGPITRAQFSGDGHSIVCASVDGTVRVFCARTLKARVVADLARRGSHEVTLDRDGTVLLAASTEGGDLVCLSFTNGRTVWRLPAKQHTVGPRPFAGSGDRLITLTGEAEGRTASVLSWPTGAALGTIGDTAMLRVAAYSHCGRRIVTGAIDGTAQIFDAATGRLQRRLKGHKAAVLDAAVLGGGRLVVTASFDRTARLWDGQTGRPLAKARFDFAPTAFAVAGRNVVFSDTIGQLFAANLPVSEDAPP